MLRGLKWWFGAYPRIVRLVLWCDGRVWGGSALFVVPAMLVMGWLIRLAPDLTALAEIGEGVGIWLGLVITGPALPAMFAAGHLFAERLWATFGIYRLFGIKGRPARDAWARLAGMT